MNDAAPPLPTTSVVIPAYNAAAHIAAAIDSVLAQSVQPLEIIVVDDGSTDETAQVVARGYPQVTLLRQDNRGCGQARNTGCAVARGDWLAFLDADDTWLPQKLEKQLGFTGDPRVAVVNARRWTPSGEEIGTEIGLETLWHSNVLIVSSTIVRRTAFEAVGGFWSERYCEDYHLWLRLAGAAWQIVNVPRDLVKYSRLVGSLSQQAERFAAAERRCLRDVAAHLGKSRLELNQRLVASYLCHAKGALYRRDLPLARRLVIESLDLGVSMGQLAYLVAASLPPDLLKLRGRFRAAHMPVQATAPSKTT